MRFKNYSFIMAAGAAILSSPVMALNVFVCEPEWKALLKRHAPNATVYSATTAKQDPHYVQARPSLIAKMRQADMAMCSGAELEVGWLPMLQARSANPVVQDGGIGMLYAAEFIQMLDTHEHIDRSMGDIHAHGNPHVQFAANDMITLSHAITERLQEIDPSNSNVYLRNGMKFRAHWQKKLNEWEQKATPLKGKKVIGYHGTYRYLFDWLDITQIADVEPKPGISPTTSHLQSLTQLSRTSFDGIVFSSHQDKRPAQWLHKQTKKPVIQLPLSVSPNQTLESMYDEIITILLSELTVSNEIKK